MFFPCPPSLPQEATGRGIPPKWKCTNTKRKAQSWRQVGPGTCSWENRTEGLESLGLKGGPLEGGVRMRDGTKKTMLIRKKEANINCR